MAEATPLRWHFPQDESSTRRAIEEAALRGRRLRVVGAGHSFSRIAVPDDEAVSLDNWAGHPIVERHRGLVRVPGGMRLHELSALLRRDGLSLPIVGSIQAQTVAGAIATGTHGSSLHYGNMSTLVTRLRLIDGNADVQVIDDDRLDAARVHLGALGVVTEVTLRVRPATTLRQSITHVPVAALTDHLAATAGSAEYVKIWWLPQTPTAQVVRYTRTTDAPSRRPSVSTQHWLAQQVIRSGVFAAMARVQRRRPELTAGINTRLSSVYLGTHAQIGGDTLMQTTPIAVRHRETEAAVPLAQAAAAVAVVLALFGDRPPPMNFPVELRFVAADGNWMSPAKGADICAIGLYLRDDPDCDRFFAAFWQLMRPLGARPHWGKEHDFEVAELRALYPDLDRFRRVRDTLDPRRMFGGDAQTRILGS